MGFNFKKYLNSNNILAGVAIILILVLAALYYYYSSKITPASYVSVVTGKRQPSSSTPKKLAVVPTEVIAFVPPETLSKVYKSGSCFASSVAAPYRKDAFRCSVQNGIYDPCFTTKLSGVVFCQSDPITPGYVLIKLTKVLPKISLPSTVKDNWAWFLTLADGTYCSPFTGTRPVLSQGQAAYYSCVSQDATQQVVLIGDLIKGEVWTAEKAILARNGASWSIKSSEKVNISKIWQ